MKTKIILLLSFVLVACGTKRSVTESHVKQRIDSAVVDNSTVNQKIDLEEKWLSTHTDERIVTLFGVRFDTVYVESERKINPVSFPIAKSENRSIDSELNAMRIHLIDSIKKSIDLKYKSQIYEKNRRILEQKETTVFYQIAAVIASVAALVLLLFLVFRR